MINILLFLNLIMVDIKGEVVNPGVFTIEKGNISDIIILAGGLTENGDTTFINMARGVTDEMVIYIPNRRDRNIRLPVCNCPPPIIKECPPENIVTTTTRVVQEITTTTTTSVIVRPTEKININTATLQELTTLNGVGPAIASRIIAFREATPFIIIEDILKVNGIGEVIFAQIKDFITV